MVEWIITHKILLVVIYCVGFICDIIGRWFTSEIDPDRSHIMPINATTFVWPIFWVIACVKELVVGIVESFRERLNW